MQQKILFPIHIKLELTNDFYYETCLQDRLNKWNTIVIIYNK